jgi:hypothetical protein
LPPRRNCFRPSIPRPAAGARRGGRVYNQLLGCLSQESLEYVAGLGGTAYIPFKGSSTGGVGGLFEKVLPFYQFHREAFLAEYHRGRTSSRSSR